MTETTEMETKSAVERLLTELLCRIDDPDGDDLGTLERVCDDLAAAIELDKADAADAVDPAVAALAVDLAHKRANEQALGILRPRIARLKVQAHKQSGEAERTTRRLMSELQEVVDALTPYEPEQDEPAEQEAELPAEEP